MSKLKQHKPHWLQYRTANRVTAYMLRRAKKRATKEAAAEKEAKAEKSSHEEDWGKEF